MKRFWNLTTKQWGIIAVFVAIITVIVGIVNPEIRRFIGLEKLSPSVTIPPSISPLPSATSAPTAEAPTRQSPTTRTHTRIEQRGTNNGAAGNIDQSGNCNINQIGGNGNQATANCAPVERHLTEQQKGALGSLVVPASIKLKVTMTNEGDAQSYAGEIVDALSITPANWGVGYAWTPPGPPRGLSVRIHDNNEPQILQDFAGRLKGILEAKGWFDARIPTGEVQIVVGKVP